MSCLTNIHKEAEVGEWEVIDCDMLVFRVEGSMPDGLVTLCRALGCFEDG